jgi:hypothetical protein
MHACMRHVCMHACITYLSVCMSVVLVVVVVVEVQGLEGREISSLGKDFVVVVIIKKFVRCQQVFCF